MMATEQLPEQLMIDGLPVKERSVKLAGQISVQPETVDALLGGEEVTVSVVARLAKRSQTFTRNEWGDDDANVNLALEVVRTKRVKREDPDLTVETRAERLAEREAERAAEREKFEKEQEAWREANLAERERDRDARELQGGELAAESERIRLADAEAQADAGTEPPLTDAEVAALASDDEPEPPEAA